MCQELRVIQRSNFVFTGSWQQQKMPIFAPYPFVYGYQPQRCYRLYFHYPPH